MQIQYLKEIRVLTLFDGLKNFQIDIGHYPNCKKYQDFSIYSIESNFGSIYECFMKLVKGIFTRGHLKQTPEKRTQRVWV